MQKKLLSSLWWIVRCKTACKQDDHKNNSSIAFKNKNSGKIFGAKKCENGKCRKQGKLIFKVAAERTKSPP